MIATRAPPCHLAIDKPVSHPITPDQFAQDNPKGAARQRHGNAKSRQRSLKAIQMRTLVHKGTVANRTDFVDAVCKLETTILDMNRRIVVPQITPIHIGKPGHDARISPRGRRAVRRY
jgi:hypothetical protein